MAQPRFLLCLLGLAHTASAGTILSKSSLETCVGSSSAGLSAADCAKKLVVTYAVPTGQNATDSLELVISSVEDASSGQQLFADKAVRLVINKTPIYFYYPTFCARLRARTWLS